MLKALKDEGWKVTVIAWDRTGKMPAPNGNQDFFDRWVWVHLPAPVWSMRLAAKLPRYYQKVIQALAGIDQPELVIVTHYFHLPLAFFLRGKKVYDAIEMYALDLSLYFGSWSGLVKPVWQWLEGLLLWGAGIDGVSAIDSRDGWLEKFYRKWVDRVQVIWNVTPHSKEPSVTEVQAAAENYAGRQVIAMVGGLMRKQGLRVALQAAALVKEQHPNALFLFMGPLKDDPEIVRELIQARHLESQVLFLEFMRYRKMLAHLRHARIGLLLYQPERNILYCGPGTGRKCFTYMQAGIPMVAPNFGEVGLLAKEENCGFLVDTTDAVEVARTITYLLDNPQEAAAMGGRGRRAFEEKYNWDREQDKYIQFIEGVWRS
jgi:glycosyltransferase involved in cell wall biosynthesis